MDGHRLEPNQTILAGSNKLQHDLAWLDILWNPIQNTIANNVGNCASS